MVQPLKPVSRSAPNRRTDAAVDALMAAVVGGTYPAGTVLPPERELAPTLGISRTSLRQAITRLEQLGVVAPHQGRGTVVQDITDTTDPRVIQQLAREHGAQFVGELFEVRQAMGALAGRLAAERATPVDLRALENSLDEAERADTPAELQRMELEFFVCLVQAANNRPLRTMLRWAEQAYGTSADTFAAAFDARDDVVEALAEIVSAVRERNPEGAAEAVGRYAQDSARRMLHALDGTDPKRYRR